MKYGLAQSFVIVSGGFAMIIAGALTGMLGCTVSSVDAGPADSAGAGGAGAAGSGILAGTGGLGGSGSAGQSGAGNDPDGAAGDTSAGGVGGSSGAAGDGQGGASGEGGAGAGGTAGGSAGMGGSGGSDGAKPMCLAKDSQVIVIGDSYINWVSHTMPEDLKTVSSQNWRMYAIGAAAMGSGGASRIPDQLEQAVTADPDMTTAVMTGGGNDILVPDPTFVGGADCKNRADAPSLPVCQMIVDLALDTAVELMDRAAEVGIKDVIYFYYPEVPEGTLIGGTHPRALLNYSLPLVRDLCNGAEERTGGKLKCHFIDTIPLFRGHDDWFAPTDIHENSLGSMAIAKEIWKVMQENCIAQKAPNDCCTN